MYATPADVCYTLNCPLYLQMFLYQEILLYEQISVIPTNVCYICRCLVYLRMSVIPTDACNACRCLLYIDIHSARYFSWRFGASVLGIPIYDSSTPEHTNHSPPTWKSCMHQNVAPVKWTLLTSCTSHRSRHVVYHNVVQTSRESWYLYTLKCIFTVYGRVFGCKQLYSLGQLTSVILYRSLYLWQQNGGHLHCKSW